MVGLPQIAKLDMEKAALGNQLRYALVRQRPRAIAPLPLSLFLSRCPTQGRAVAVWCSGVGEQVESASPDGAPARHAAAAKPAQPDHVGEHVLIEHGCATHARSCVCVCVFFHVVQL